MLLLFLSLISAANLFLGFLVWFRNRRNPSNIAFLAMTALIVGWLFTNYLADHAVTNALNLLFTKTTMFFALLAIFSFYIFSAVFMEKAVKPKRQMKIALVLTLAVAVLSVATNTVIKSTSITNDVTEVAFGGLSFAYFTSFLCLLAASLARLYLRFRSSRGIEKKRLYFLAVGLAVTSLTATVSNLIMPTLFNYFSLSPFGGLATIFFTGFTSYAIVKHRLMDIRLIIVRSISFSLLLVVLISGFAFPLYKLMFWATENGVGAAGQIGIGAAAAVFIGILIPYIRKGLTKATDAIFFKQEYSPEKFQKEVGNILSSNIILSELLHKTLDHIIKEFRLFEGMFVVTEGDQVYTIQSIGYKKPPEVAFKDVKSLCSFPIVVYDELEEGSRAKNILRKYEVSIVVPLIEEHQFAGVLLLGDKKSGDMFSSKDISTLEIIAPEIAMAMQRAKQYEEIQRFNVTLKAEVLRATRKLTEANEHLKELDKAKDEFISMASHQLRTPLTAIKGYLSMLLEGDAGDIKIGQYDFIDEAFKGANKMVALINDLLNVSRMSTGKFFIDPKELDMKVTINDEIKQLAVTARQKGLYLKFEHPKVMPIVEADENKIRQVIMNFIDNALFYTEKGGVTVKAMYNKHDFVFEVHDTGIGVPREVQGKLFAKFYRADNARKLRPDGNGLGLYLAKRVVEDHGGEIIFRSGPKGSVFGFRIPIKSKIKAEHKSYIIKNKVMPFG